LRGGKNLGIGSSGLRQRGRAAVVVSRLSFVVGCLALAGCPRPDSAARPDIEMDALHIKTGADDLGLETYDAQTLMEKGAEVFNAGKHDKAALYFQRVLSEYPESSRVPAALFNLGLCAETAGDFERAKGFFERVVQEHGGEGVALDARFRLGACLSALKRYDEALKVFSALQEVKDLSENDRLEASVNVGVCLTGLNRLDDAETELFHAMIAYRKISQKEYIENNYFMAQGQFYLGEINRARMETVKLEFPQEKLEKDLEQKAQFLLDAQNAYIKAIRIGNLHWAAASGFRIGGLYETFHQQLVAAPVPPDLTEEQAAVYRDELRKKVAVLLAKAINVYERNLDMAQRVGLTSKWVDETNSRLEKLKEQYLKENLQ